MILPPTRKAIRIVKESIAKRRIVEELDLLKKRKVEEFDLLRKRKVEEFEGLIGRNTLIREAVQIVKETVIPVSKSRIIQELRGLIGTIINSLDELCFNSGILLLKKISSKFPLKLSYINKLVICLGTIPVDPCY